ncbi:MAG TPA: M13 family metallopeptidase [Kofleriaceae bacterium]|nr:M13 family metallopeptidase [Kofleriaceae bacterium]
MQLRNALMMLAIAACSGKAAPATTTTATPPTTPPGPTKPATTGTGSGSASAPAPLASAPGVKVTLADVGLEAGSLDRTADPCIDFYQFACGGWLANNQIPADRARWGRFAEIDEKNKAAIRGILEEAAKGIGGDTTTKKLGDFYASCMDEGVIERAGLGSLRPLLDRTTKVKDPKSWLAAVTELHKVGNWVVWQGVAAADLKASTMNVMYIDSARLGLPDRDYYVKADFKDKVDAYKLHVGKMLALAGTPQAKADAAAADVLAIETELAKLTKTAVERRDIPASYNPTDLKALGKTVKLDWKTYWKALGVDPGKLGKIVVGTPKFFAALDKLRAKFKYPQWASYFTYHAVSDVAFALPKPFDNEAFELERVLTGVEKQKDRSKRCIEATQGGLGELLGQVYVGKYFPPASKQTATTLVDALVKQMGEELGKLDWMSEPTRQIAQQKLGKVVRMIGYPEKWRSYDFEVKRADFAGNALRAAAFETRRLVSRAGKPVDRSEWQMNTYTVNAYYEPTANNTALPAGILQPPFFAQDRSVAANLGGIGMVIGHELTHGFDDQGAQFDAEGNLKNWWQKDDEKKFADKGTCVAEQYSTFEALPKQFVNGRLTLGENIADLGGVKMAFRAYRSLRKDAQKLYVADGFDEDQQFFLAVGQAWCSKDRPAEIQRRLTVDPHSPPKFRVYGALRNLKEFAEAFKCAPGTPMRPAQTCSVW